MLQCGIDAQEKSGRMVCRTYSLGQMDDFSMPPEVLPMLQKKPNPFT